RRRRMIERLETALAVEIIGFAVLLEAEPGFEGFPTRRPEADEALERIVRLLHLTAPERYPMSVLEGVRSGDRRLAAAAIEYLDVTLPSPYRQFLVPLLERWSAARVDELQV